jgi:phenylalanyl-tRNA synthetase beta chain
MWKKFLSWFGAAKQQEIEEALHPHIVSKYVGVVVGEVLEVRPHPNADRLRLAKVNIGSEILAIVCGAPNLAVGQKVPTALVGAKLPNGLEIKPAKIRGEESFGMLCAADELGLGEDHAGIMVFDGQALVGADIDGYLPKHN